MSPEIIQEYHEEADRKEAVTRALLPAEGQRRSVRGKTAPPGDAIRHAQALSDLADKIEEEEDVSYYEAYERAQKQLGVA